MVVLCSSICFTFSDLCPSVVLDERPSVQNRFCFQGHLLGYVLVIEDEVSIARYGACKRMFSSKTLALVTIFH